MKAEAAMYQFGIFLAILKSAASDIQKTAKTKSVRQHFSAQDTSFKIYGAYAIIAVTTSIRNTKVEKQGKNGE